MNYCSNCGSELGENDRFCSNCGMQIVPYKEERFKYAGFWRRFVAALIDGIIISGAGSIIAKILDIPTSIDPTSLYLYEVDSRLAVWRLVAALATWLYYALFESSSKQATPGKMALGIVVTDYEGGRISFGKATGRYFSKIISAIILLVGYIMAAFTEQKQALHDIIAGTLVIQKERYEEKYIDSTGYDNL